jgi:hypothetical protein
VDIGRFKGTVFYWIWSKYKDDKDKNKPRWEKMWNVINEENLTEYIVNLILDPAMLQSYLGVVDFERYYEAKNLSIVSKDASNLTPDEREKLFQAVKMGTIDEIDEFVKAGVNLAEIKTDDGRTLSQLAVDEGQLILDLPLEDNLIWLHLFNRDKFRKWIKQKNKPKRKNFKKGDKSNRDRDNSPNKDPVIMPLMMFFPDDKDSNTPTK